MLITTATLMTLRVTTSRRRIRLEMATVGMATTTAITTTLKRNRTTLMAKMMISSRTLMSNQTQTRRCLLRKQPPLQRMTGETATVVATVTTISRLVSPPLMTIR